MKRLILIDFCGTVVNIQTGDKFIYQFTKYNFLLKIMYFLLRLFRKVLYIFKIYKLLFFHLDKRVFLPLIKGLSQKTIQNTALEYADFLYKHHINSKLEEYLIKFIQEDDLVIVLSAGYYDYIKFFNFKYRIDHIIESNFIYDENLSFSGEIDRSVYGKDKINVLIERNILNKEVKSNVIVFTDSYSDMPLINLASEIICVNPDKRLRKKAKENGWNIM
jgi:phosphoserine phosphatase